MLTPSVPNNAPLAEAFTTSPPKTRVNKSTARLNFAASLPVPFEHLGTIVWTTSCVSCRGHRSCVKC